MENVLYIIVSLVIRVEVERLLTDSGNVTGCRHAGDVVHEACPEISMRSKRNAEGYSLFCPLF